MKPALPACVLLLWTLTAPVSCNSEGVAPIVAIEVTETSNGIKLRCTGGYQLKSESGKILDTLEYKDEYSGEYKCVSTESTESTTADYSLDGEEKKKQKEGPKIYVKFRTCENCIELDTVSITGIVVGDLMATIVIGVSVYIVASQTRISPVPSHKKSSDRQHLVPNEVTRDPNETYQPLRERQKDTYDVLTKK